MKRSELLRRILALPADADVGVQIGEEHLDIADVVAWGDGAFGALRCCPADSVTLCGRGRCPGILDSDARSVGPKWRVGPGYRRRVKGRCRCVHRVLDIDGVA